MSKSENKSSPTQRWFNPPSVASLRRELDNLLENFFGTTGLAEVVHANTPSLDLSETDTSVEVTTDVPGYSTDEIHVEVGDGCLVISGEHKQIAKPEEEGRKFHRVERRLGVFSRSVTLPCSVKEDKVKAELKDGVLRIVLPKSDDTRRHKVSIKSLS